jgi:coproporphyrinogen III oxidase-like Fe-S oxidoreductase
MLKLAPLAPSKSETDHDLAHRMQGPQRHRLLQGYPMPGLMKEFSTPNPVIPDPSRKLIVGILPHASCNPSVLGCGYCTFPHESFQRSKVSQTVKAVISEIESSPLAGRKVEALYFGGGTANLTPSEDFEGLCAQTAECFDLHGSEVTLEGAPVYFSLSHRTHLASLRRHFRESSLRLSMGVQTFDLAQIERMGRSHIGHPRQVAAAVRVAQKLGISTSADMLINLPGQTPAHMRSDLLQASELGFSQICLYHLVLFRGLGTPWSADQDLLKALPNNHLAFENWQEMRQLLLSLGYRQRSLTNFERQDNYRYEECSYTPQRYDGAGFGPAALSTYTDSSTHTAVKWMNPESSQAYREGSQSRRCFVYGQTDLRLLHLTRNLAKLQVSIPDYQHQFGTTPQQDFPEEFSALNRAGLIEVGPTTIHLTLSGMFYADSVAGLLASRRIREIRRGANNEARYHVMG